MKESSIIRHSSFIGSLSMMKCRLLLLKIPRPSVPIHRWRRDEIFYSQCSQGLSPHKITISLIFLKLFCHVTFSCWFRTILSRSVGWVWFSTGSSYTSSSRYTTVVGAPLSNCSNWVPSLANNANFHCCVHLSNERGDVTVGFSQKASIWRGVSRILTADCAMLCLLAVLLANWVTVVYLSAYLSNCDAIAELELMNLSFNLGIFFLLGIFIRHRATERLDFVSLRTFTIETICNILHLISKILQHFSPSELETAQVSYPGCISDRFLLFSHKTNEHITFFPRIANYIYGVESFLSYFLWIFELAWFCCPFHRLMTWTNNK